jgi:hypothetical protein
MEKEVKIAVQTVGAMANDAFAVSTLSSMKPGELFRLAAELASTWDLGARGGGATSASRRYVE